MPTLTIPIKSSGATSIDDQWVGRDGSSYPPSGALTRNTDGSPLSLWRGYDPVAYGYRVRLALLAFDTSALSDSDTVTSATLRVHVDTVVAQVGRTLIGEYYYWDGSDSDWVAFASSSDALAEPISNIGAGAYHDIALKNPDLISKSGRTRLRLHIGGDEPAEVVRVHLHSYESAYDPPTLIIEYAEGQSASVNAPAGGSSVPRAAISTTVAVSPAAATPTAAEVPRPSITAPVHSIGAIAVGASVGRPTVVPGFILPTVIRVSAGVGSVVELIKIVEPAVVGVGISLARSRLRREEDIRRAVALKKESAHYALARTLDGSRGPIEMRHRLFISDASGAQITELTQWESGSIECNNNRSAAWTITVEMAQTDGFDPISDYVVPATDVRVGGEWRRFEMGLYRFTFPDPTHLEALRWWSLEGESPEGMLARSWPTTEYVATAGAGVLATVTDILTSLGVPQSAIDFPPSSEDRALTSDMSFTPFDNASESNWLSICNALLGARSFYALKTDKRGKFVTRAITDLSTTPPAVHYSDTAGGEQMIVGDPSEDTSDERLANAIYVTSDDVDQSPQVYAVAENHDPDSPVSIEAIGLWPKRVKQQSIASLEDAARLASAELAKATSFYRKTSFATLADPRRDVGELYEMTVHSARAKVMEGIWDVNSFSYPLGDDFSTMSHEVGKVAKIG